MINYEYIETENKEIIPDGEGWEFWNYRKNEKEKKAVWRRNYDKYGELNE